MVAADGAWVRHWGPSGERGGKNCELARRPDRRENIVRSTGDVSRFVYKRPGQYGGSDHASQMYAAHHITAFPTSSGKEREKTQSE